MEFEHIVMKCKDENVTYPDPVEMFNKDGTCKYAYVTLVMLGDSYIAGAIMVAYSVRKAGSVADLVVLVTPDVSDDGKNVLRKFFTHVIGVDFITVPNWRVKKQPHRKYLELVFTKFHLFNLIQYEKVLLIDADAIVLKHPDHLFTLNAPAGSLIEYKDQLITYDKKGNYIYPRDGELKWYKEMCGCCEHGKKIDKKITDKVFSDFKNSGVAAGLWLLKPDPNELDRILKDVNSGKSKWLVGQKYVWPEQQYLTGFYSGQWTSINPRFYGLQGYPHWSVLYGMQYAGDKPFVEHSKVSITERMKYTDFVLWHQFYQDILTAYPELLDALPLKEANNMNKFFQSSIRKQKRIISRTESNLGLTSYTSQTQLEKNVLSKIYSINIENISDTQLKYYHNDIDRDYRNLKPVLENVSDNYLDPLRRLAKYFDSDKTSSNKSYYSTLLEKCKDIKLSNRLDQMDSVTPIIDQTDKDLIMLEYIKSTPNISVLTFFPIVLQQTPTDKIMKEIEFYGKIIYTKKITLAKYTLYNLMFWMYDEYTYDARLEFINKKIKYIPTSDTNEILIVYLESTQNLDSLFSQIRKLSDLEKNRDIDNTDIAHFTNFFYQTVEYSQIVLNENTLKMLDYQNISNISNNLFTESRLKMQTFKKWCTQNLSQLEIDRLLIIQDSVLFSYGIRKINNIRGILTDIGNKNSQSEEELAELLNDNFAKNNSSFNFLNVQNENHPEYYNKYGKEFHNILNFFDLESVKDVSTNPHNHYYFGGFKICLPKLEFYRKIYETRQHIQSQPSRKIDQIFADFLMITALDPSLISEFVRLSEGKLLYDKKFSMSEFKFDHNYLKTLFKIIFTQYTQNDIEKFKKLVILI